MVRVHLIDRIGIGIESYLSDSLAVLATVQDSPGNATGVLALEEEGLGFAVLETEDLGVSTDVELTLHFENRVSISVYLKVFAKKKSPPLDNHDGHCTIPSLCSCDWLFPPLLQSSILHHKVHSGPSPRFSRNIFIIVPCRGRSSGRRMCRRKSSF